MNAAPRPRAPTLYEYIESLPEGYTGEIVDGTLCDAGACRGDEAIRLPPFDAAAIRLPWP